MYCLYICEQGLIEHKYIIFANHRICHYILFQLYYDFVLAIIWLCSMPYSTTKIIWLWHKHKSFNTQHITTILCLEFVWTYTMIINWLYCDHLKCSNIITLKNRCKYLLFTATMFRLNCSLSLRVSSKCFNSWYPISQCIVEYKNIHIKIYILMLFMWFQF